MSRRSTKTDKTVYQLAREEAGLTREEAEAKMQWLSADQIDKIERGVRRARPEEVMVMADCYKRPDLNNYYCAHECEIGKKNVPEVKVQDLSNIVLEAINSLNKLDKEKNRIIEIAVDGKISPDEYADFSRIQNELDSISMAVASLQLWVDKTIAVGKIDEAELAAERAKLH